MAVSHEICSNVILLLPLIEEGLVSVKGERYVHEVLVKRLVNSVQEKVW